MSIHQNQILNKMKLVIIFLGLLFNQNVFGQTDTLKGKVKCITESEIDSVGKVLVKRIINFNLKGNKVQEIAIDGATQRVMSKDSYKYDKFDLLKTRELKMYGADTTILIYKVIYKYDTKGNIIETIEPNKKQKYSYDKNGEMTSGDDNVAVEVLMTDKVVIHYEYDTIGNWIIKTKLRGTKILFKVERVIVYY